jgi:hypothetical protein
MDWCRGIFRLWVIISGIWVVYVAILRALTYSGKYSLVANVGEAKYERAANHNPALGMCSNPPGRILAL